MFPQKLDTTLHNLDREKEKKDNKNRGTTFMHLILCKYICSGLCVLKKVR